VHDPDTGNKILTSTISSPSPGSNCPAASPGPLCTATVTISQLAINFTASTATTTPGGVVRYTATLANTGQTPYLGISVNTDSTGISDDATGNGDQTASSGTLSVGPDGAVWTGDIAPGGTVTITSSATVNNPDTGDHILTATAVSAAPGNNCPAGGTDPACTPVTNVLTPALTIVKTANASAAVPGQVIGYTITITNTGQTAYTGATVTDSFAQMDGDAVYNGNAAATTGTLSFTSPDLTWTGDLAPGAAAVITYSVTVNNPDTGDKLVINTVSSAETGSTCPPGTTAAGCRVTVPVLTPALTITKTSSTATATPGSTVSYTITVANTGQVPYSGATVTDPLGGVLDDAAYNNDATATTGSVIFTSPTLTWTGNLAPGAAATVTYSITVHNPDPGDHVLTNTVTSAAAGSNCPVGSTDPRCTTSTDVTALTITNTVSVATTTPGSVVAYTVTITNTGQTVYDDAAVTDPLAGVLDDAVYNSGATATAGSVTFTSPTLTWTGDLNPGDTATITFSVTVNDPDTGDKSLTSTITSPDAGNNCPVGGTDPACTATVTVLIPALSITKTADTATTTPGSTVGYTITVTDTGPTPYTAATVTDALDGILNDAAYNNNATATTGTVSFTSPDLTWTGDLTPGQTATITYTVTVANPDTGDKQLINTATSDDPGSTCPTGTANTACTVTVVDQIPALTITKTASVATATPGSTVGYTITVDNTGQTPYTGASVTDSLAGVLGDAAYNNNAAASTGTVSYASPVLSWTGDLATGQTATITYTVTVNNPDTGGRVLANTAVSAATGSTCPSGSTSPGCTATVTIISGVLSITAPASASLGSANPGGIIGANLGTVQVTDGRGFGAGWTATVATTAFTTGNGTPAEIIPPENATYAISALSQTTGSATFTFAPRTNLSFAPQAVVAASNVTGNTSATWNPLINIQVPASAVGGTYTATITHSVS
jgi:uncharacterized repeat protein (TIGR01451 family)